MATGSVDSDRRAGDSERADDQDGGGRRRRAVRFGPPLPWHRKAAPRRRRIAWGLFAAAALGLVYVGLPRIAGLGETWQRVMDGDPWWLALALLCEGLSFAGYVVLFRAVFGAGATPITWRQSYRITLAGVVATRLLAAGGAGGVVLTAWALRRAGVEARRVAVGMTAFLVLLYSVFMLALLVGGAGLRLGLLPGEAPFGLTVVPAVFGAAVIVLALASTSLRDDLGERLVRRFRRSARTASVVRRLAPIPATVGAGVRDALALAGSRDPRLLGALAWWSFDVAVLWACLKAFGSAPSPAVIVVGYFVGTLANLLPLPGGVGGVESGMIGALVAFGVPGGLAIVGVLAYRGIAFWLPVAPGAVAYAQLLRDSRRSPGVAAGGRPPVGGSTRPRRRRMR